MYLGIDVGGTKTLLASLDDNGVIQEEVRFPTPKKYTDFLRELSEKLEGLSQSDFRACGIGVPGRVDTTGRGLSFGNLPWKNVHIQADIEHLVHCPVVVENDAKLAGLSEAMLAKEFRRVLYITVSTGIGIGYIIDQRIDPNLRMNEGGHILLEHHGVYQPWEKFASGSAIVRQFGKPMQDIDDEHTLRIIARNLTIGFIDHIAILTPDLLVIGGSVGTHYSKYRKYLLEYLKKYETPMIPLPEIRSAKRPEKAVIYGCFDAAREKYS